MILRSIALLLVLSMALFAVGLSSITSSEEKDNIKLELNFDKSFEGNIDKNVTSQGVLLTFHGLNVEQRKDLTFQSAFAQKAVLATISTDNSVLFIEAIGPVNINTIKTPDGLKATVVVTPAPVPVAQNVQPMSDSSVGEILGWRYVVVICFMVALIVVLFIVKKKMQKGAPSAISGLLAKTNKDDIKIVSQKYIDNSNKIMLLEYDDAKYLILVGSSSMVIDKFYDNVSDISDSDLQKALAFTQLANGQKQKEKDKEPFSDFDEYKMRAEGDYEGHPVNKWGKIE